MNRQTSILTPLNFIVRACQLHNPDMDINLYIYDYKYLIFNGETPIQLYITYLFDHIEFLMPYEYLSFAIQQK
jgi:hypothetical protein